MGWFLGTSNNKGRKKKATRSKATASEWDPQVTLARLRIVAVAGLAIGLIVAWFWSESALREYASTHKPAPVAPESVELRHVPAKLIPESERNRIKRTVAARVEPDPLDGESLRHAANALRSIAWIRQVHQVRRMSDGRVRVDADYRIPAAVIHTSGGFRLVDHQGVLLPGRWGEHQLDELAMPLITGVTAQHMPDSAGLRWDDTALDAGLALAHFLGTEPWMNQVRAIEVGERDDRDRVRLVLRTESGKVIWGLPPGQELPIEPPARDKRAWIGIVHTEHGSIDAGGQVVDAVFGGRLRVDDELPGGSQSNHSLHRSSLLH